MTVRRPSLESESVLETRANSRNALKTSFFMLENVPVPLNNPTSATI